MNYYKSKKLAKIDEFKDMALPEASLFPAEGEIDWGRQGGIGKIDRELTEEEAEEQERVHPSLEFLGAGNVGVAYLPGSGSEIVVKYTSSVYEYRNALNIINIQKETRTSVPGVITVYHAEVVSREKDIYKIWLEKVSPLPDAEKDALYKMLWIVRYSIQDLEAYDTKSLLGRSEMSFTDENIVMVNKMRRLGEAMNENKLFGDMHPGNIGKDSNGEYVILDIGGLF